MQPGVPGGAKEALLALAMLPNGNIPKDPSSLGQDAGRHHTKKRYPPEQASGAGRQSSPLQGRASRTKRRAVTLRAGLRARLCSSPHQKSRPRFQNPRDDSALMNSPSSGGSVPSMPEERRQRCTTA